MIYQRIVIGQFQNQHLVWNDTRVANCSCQMPTQTYKNSYHFSLSFKLLWQNRCNKSCCLFVKGFITQFDALGRFQMQLMAMASWLIRQVGFWTACHIKMNWSCLTVQKRVSIKCLCEMRPVSSFWTLIFGGLAAAEDCRTCVSKFFQWWNGWLCQMKDFLHSCGHRASKEKKKCLCLGHKLQIQTAQVQKQFPARELFNNLSNEAFHHGFHLPWHPIVAPTNHKSVFQWIHLAHMLPSRNQDILFRTKEEPVKKARIRLTWVSLSNAFCHVPIECIWTITKRVLITMFVEYRKYYCTILQGVTGL